MAQIEEFVIRFTADELRAIHFALGTLASEKYGNARIAAAGSDAYDQLTPFADEENWDD